MGKEKEVSQQLEVMDGYVVELNKFYKMSESDWVILRFLVATNDYPNLEDVWIKAHKYLDEKYGDETIYKCWLEIRKEEMDE